MVSNARQERSFRDNLATIDEKGRRLWVYPLRPGGIFYKARTALATLLLGFLFAAPFITVDGHPYMLLDIIHRRFYIFGSVFHPHDFYLIVIGLISLALFLILFTAAFGRLFCGWVCPQTIFMEMVFRRIEFWIEGDGPKQKRLDRAPLSGSKVIRKGIKHSLFLIVSVLLTSGISAWFVGQETVLLIWSNASEHSSGFVVMGVFSLLIYGTYARFREQMCTLVCPYGRLQSVLLDPNSIVVAYDFKRGEPRGRFKQGQERITEGDCINCQACVRVCPTGIDIRNGTQLECVNCTACIDVCNSVMDRVGLPRKLIKYSSYNSIAHGQPFRFSGRLVAYGTVLAALLSLLVFLGVQRDIIETTVLRTTGSLYTELEDGTIRNLYTVKIFNRTADDLKATLRLKGVEGRLNLVGPPLLMEGNAAAQSVFTIEIGPASLSSAKVPILIEVVDGDRVLEEVETTFHGPEANR
jgi:cytochrome c oxidase accessory protein FixG